MIKWIDLKLRLRALLFRQRAESDLNEELAFHLAMTARKNQMKGMSERDANRNAQVQFGGLEQAKEECRDARGLIWLQTLWQDLRYAIRTFSHSKGFFLTVVLTIALALGLNTALFSVFNAYMLRPLAVRDPFSLFRVSWSSRSGGFFFTPPEAKQVVTGNAKFYEALSYEPVFAKAKAQSLFGNRVSLNYFSLLGVDMAMGRPLREEDGLAAGLRGIVLSHGSWQAKFGADPEILGKELPMFGGVYEVVGVARQGFNGVGQVPSDFWIPRLPLMTRAPYPGKPLWSG